MCRNWLYGLCMAALLAASGAVQAAVFIDNFDTSHDFLADGVTGTRWDGFVGRGANETAAAINASIDRPGQLYLASADGVWAPPWNPLGPFLYKVIEGDFVASVKVTDYAGTAAAVVYHNNAGLMARAFPGDAGPGENWVSLDYFPIWNCGNFVRSANNNVRTEHGHNGRTWNLDPWMQIERRGNTFHFRTSADGVTWTEMAQSPLTRDDLADIPLQVGVKHATYSAEMGYAAFDEFRIEGPLVIPGYKAYRPTPADKFTDVLADVVLSWVASETAQRYDVYFGTVAADVADADRANALGTALAVGQDLTHYDVGRLELGQTYFWRVDEIRADGVTIDRGDVWSFTVEPYAYPITGVTATASSLHQANMGPQKTVDGSGLTDDRHSNVSTTMWLSIRGDPEPWIQYEFDRIYKVHQMLVWNSNQEMETVLGLGVKDVIIEYSMDGSAWESLGEVELAQASGDPTLMPETVNLGGILARFIRLTIQSNWGGFLAQYGLSEVRFLSVPVLAREPKPVSGAAGVHPQVTLSWRAGREAVLHELALSADEQAVIDGSAPAVTLSEARYEAALDLDRSYFWKVTEVNEAASPPTWEGHVWTFSTAEYIVVDNFESYTDDVDAGEAIFQAWDDGWQVPANGSQVGHSVSPFAERTTVRSGRQSMPLSYENTLGVAYSEAKRTFEVAENWSRHGITTLVVHFHGLATNSPVPLYVKINDTKVLYNAGAAATALPLWKQWNIDLAGTGANLQSVRSLTIGVEGSGTGTLFIDDIRLYREAPSVVVPADPSAAGIVARYAMDGNVQDGSGRNNHGTIGGTAVYEEAPAGRGQALVFNGTNTYVDLPIGSLIATLSDVTVSTYVNFPNIGGAWQRIFDFGTDTTNYMFLCPRIGTSGPMRFAIRTATVGEQIVNSTTTLPSDWHHVAVVIDSATMTVRLYLDGMIVGTGATTLLPRDLGNTTQNRLGRSQFEADAYFTGMLDEFRIYNRALSEAEIRYLAGDR